MHDFKETKRIALVALYEFMIRSSGQEWLFAEDVNREAKEDFPIVYLRKALSSLEDEELVGSEFHSGTGKTRYSIAERGILTVQQTLLPNEVPASDRIVSFSDNEPELDQIRSDLSKLSEGLKKANDVGDISDEEREAAANEVEQLSELLSCSSVRLSTIKSFSIRSLTWIGEKAGGTVVGTLAGAILTAIASHFGFSI